VKATRAQFYKRRIVELEAQLQRRDERIAALEKQNAKLSVSLRSFVKNSPNCSKVLSSGVVKPPTQTQAIG